MSLPLHTSAFEECSQLWCCCWGPDNTTLLNAQSPAPGATSSVETLPGWLPEHPVRGVTPEGAGGPAAHSPSAPAPFCLLVALCQAGTMPRDSSGAEPRGLLQSKQPGPASVLSLM